jgi:hypothetical protein
MRAGPIIGRSDEAQSGGLVVGEENRITAAARQEFYACIGLALVLFKGERKFAIAGEKRSLGNLPILGTSRSRARSRAGTKEPAARKEQCNYRQARQKEEQQLLPSH